MTRAATAAVPAPTLVVGVGRMGLAVLERLGEDWAELERAGADASIQNLRLVRLAPVEEDEAVWRERETESAAIAAHVEESDLPSLCLDLVILRSLGLVRVRDGSYELAIPRDRGVYDPGAHRGSGRAEAGDEDGDGDDARDSPAESLEPFTAVRLTRRRFFEWHALSCDPVAAAERLRRLSDRVSEVERFLSPILSRVRQGHSPRTLLSTIARAAALRDGRDPSPWPWVAELVRELPPQANEALEVEVAEPRTAPAPLALELDLAEGPLEGFAPDPLPQWRRWLHAVEPEILAGIDRDPAASTPSAVVTLPAATSSEAEDEAPRLRLVVPGRLLPRQDDVGSWLDPHHLLALDWQASGWILDESTRAPFEISPASSFRLGLFDHDGRSGRCGDRFARSLEELGREAHKGLVRLWVDLRREQVEQRHALPDDRRRDHDEDALQQSLLLLDQLLVEPMTGERPEEDGEDGRREEDRRREAASPADGADLPRSAQALPAHPSRFLESLVAERVEPDSEAVLELERRLAELGLASGAGPVEHPLFHEIELGRGELDPADAGDGEAPRTPTLYELRRHLNREVRQLFDRETLASHRNRPSRLPVRLTVYLVGDMGEPFVRAAMRPLLHAVHAELLRSFAPILEDFREGFDRGLSVVPILWMPHPADPFGGGGDLPCRIEEAAIIDSVHAVRRWVEAVIPASRRRVSQIFVNSRVTDAAVLGLRDSVRQTRDFITFQMRNDLGRDPWLRRTADGVPSDDFFSSFTCYEIDFPAEKGREYLANRLARDAVHELRSAGTDELPEPREDLLAPPRLDEWTGRAREDLRAELAPLADRLAQRVEGDAERMVEAPLLEVAGRFDERFGRELEDEVQREWQRLVAGRGTVDELTDRLRRRVFELLARRLPEVEREGDRWMEEFAARGGVRTAIEGLRRLRQGARDRLERAERLRRERSQLVSRHRVPSLDALSDARRRVLEAARRRPDRRPIEVGLVLWTAMAAALGAPLAHALAEILEMARRWPWLEPVFGHWGWASGGLLLVLAAWGGLELYRRRRTERLARAIRGFAGAARRVVLGPEERDHEEVSRAPAPDEPPSLASFFDTRLLLAESLARRGFALRLHERVAADYRHAERIDGSLAVQSHRLRRRAEELGVRFRRDRGRGAVSASHAGGDDVSRLFTTRGGDEVDRLLAPERLLELYESWSAGGDEVRPLLPRLLAEAGGFERWRESACLADVEALLGVGRREFDWLVEHPLHEQHRFSEEVGERLCTFVCRLFPNIGFGARFRGYEGLDPDDVQVSADATLVLAHELEPVFHRASEEGYDGTVGRSLDVQPVPIRPSSAYMLSLAQGIRAHSVHNLKRFESFHGRTHLPSEPLGGERARLHQVSHFGDLARDLDRLFRTDRDGRAAEPEATP